ncbi:putative sensor domain DACNV-containing protein [Arcticibacter eurypsychrophilus]|uniref:putative sensor domain DACNV-containing protein n=1 Tax=Arcticibacter eurypsychrophilus TaxID=1434752 RepID=UPI00084DA21A|nr:hypothetical protein [Arcticibacter eurypsychrophilus]
MTRNYDSTYMAARSVAETVEAHFAHHVSAASEQGMLNLAKQPPACYIEAMIDAAFWASLRKEEGRSPRISIAFLAPDQVTKALLFESRQPLTPLVLTKLAPGVERPGIHLGVWYDEDGLFVWGTTIKLPNFCFVLDVSEPGLLVIKHRRMCGFGKYSNVAVLKGDQIKVVDESCVQSLDCPPIVKALLDLSSFVNHSVNVLIQLAVSMRAHGQGGILLVVPADNTEWKHSVIQPMQYAVNPPFTGLAEMVWKEGIDRSESVWQSMLNKEVDNIGGLTAIDGATILNDQHELIAFGAKIGIAKTSVRIERVALIEPIVGGEADTVHPGKIGGTRHLSAAQFVHDQHDAIALVASQDGVFTIFSWSPSANIVQAHRIDTLLL